MPVLMVLSVELVAAKNRLGLAGEYFENLNLVLALFLCGDIDATCYGETAEANAERTS